MRKFLTLAMATMLALAACGGSDKASAPTTAPTTVPATTSAPTTTITPTTASPSTTRPHRLTPTTTIPVSRDTKIAALGCARDLFSAALALHDDIDSGVDQAYASCDEAEVLLKVDEGTGADKALRAITSMRLTISFARLTLLTDGTVGEKTANDLFDQGFNIESDVSAALGVN